MSTWNQLDTYLGTLTARVGGDAYIFADLGKLQLSPPGDQPAERLARFERASETLYAVFGREHLKKGHWKRHLHHEEGNWFVAEPVVSAYQLIFLFDADYEADAWITRVLDKARPVLAELVSGLPPLDGGRRTMAAEQEP